MKSRIISTVIISIILLIAMSIIVSNFLFNDFILNYLPTPYFLIFSGLTSLITTIIIVSIFLLLNKESISSLGFYKKNGRRILHPRTVLMADIAVWRTQLFAQ